jgi:prepilin-type N-terminal cleavage/methylation domain-containing protein
MLYTLFLKTQTTLKMPSLPSSAKAFTLIEIMITLVIISLLSGIALSGFQNVQRRSRDAQRVVSIQQITRAVDSAYSATRGSVALSKATGPFKIVSSVINPAEQFDEGTPIPDRSLLLSRILRYLPNNKFPLDPINTGEYVYTLHVNSWQSGVVSITNPLTAENLALQAARISVTTAKLEGSLPEENTTDVRTLNKFSRESSVSTSDQGGPCGPSQCGLPNQCNGENCPADNKIYVLGTSCGTACALKP